MYMYEYHMMYIWQYDYTGRSLPSDVYYRTGYYMY